MDKTNAIEVRNMSKQFKVEYDKANTLKTNLSNKGLDDELIAIKPIKELGAYTERIAPCWCITSAAKNPEGIFKGKL